MVNLIAGEKHRAGAGAGRVYAGGRGARSDLDADRSRPRGAHPRRPRDASARGSAGPARAAARRKRSCASLTIAEGSSARRARSRHRRVATVLCGAHDGLLRSPCVYAGRMRTLMMCGMLLALTLPVRATTIIPADLGELSRDARAIVRGRVAALDTQWTEDRGTIETIVTLEVERYLKGAFGPTLRFRVPGGDLGRFRSIVVGAPEFAVDERVVVFLGARGPSVPLRARSEPGCVPRRPRRRTSGWLVTPPAIAPVRGRRRAHRPRRPVAPSAAARRVRAARACACCRARNEAAARGHPRGRAALGQAQPALAYLKFGVTIGGRQVTLKWAQTPVRYFVLQPGHHRRQRRGFPGRAGPRVRDVAGGADGVDRLSVRRRHRRAARTRRWAVDARLSEPPGARSRPGLDQLSRRPRDRGAARVRHLLQLRVSVVGRARRRAGPVRSRKRRAARNRSHERPWAFGARRNRDARGRRPPRPRGGSGHVSDRVRLGQHRRANAQGRRHRRHHRSVSRGRLRPHLGQRLRPGDEGRPADLRRARGRLRRRHAAPASAASRWTRRDGSRSAACRRASTSSASSRSTTPRWTASSTPRGPSTSISASCSSIASSWCRAAATAVRSP